MQGFIAAQEMGVVDQWPSDCQCGSRARPGDPEVAAGVWQSAGLDAAGLTEAIQTQPVKDALLQNTQQAADRGAFGVPTFCRG